MTRTARRASTARRFEALEPRTLLNGDPVAGSPLACVDPARSILVRFTPGALAQTTQQVLHALSAAVDESFPGGTTLITVDQGVDRDAALSELRANPLVVYAEPDSTLHASAILPNDSLFFRQWGLNNSNDVDIDAPQAWSVTTGSPGVVVAVLDSGVDNSHPDLASKLWVNPGEIPGNRADDDHDGYVDDVNGWNFVTGNNNIRDDNGHGSHVAGILGAASNNALGVAGVNWNARIMPLKIIGRDGSGSIDAAVSAVYYAVQHGARVINASWDGPEYSQALADAINYAGSQGVVFVTAAGNETANNDFVPTYPANFRLPNLLSVAAVDSSGSLASFSNYGATTVDLAAPGVNIWSTVPGGYASYSGTSMAAPFVAGVAALVIGQNPGLTAAQVARQIVTSVKPLPALLGRTISGGIVDAFNALASHRVNVDYTQGVDPGSLTVVRNSTADWISLNPATGNVQSVPFGWAGVDVPVPANYDGAGRLDFAVFRPPTAEWFIQGPGGGRVVRFGAPGDIPVPADYDGDGRTDIAVFRPSNATWYILGSSAGPWSKQFGAANLDQPVPADFDGDGRADLAVFRPTTAEWFIMRSALGPTGRQFGPAGISIPVPGDYDGDGRADLAVYRPDTSTWYILRSTYGLVVAQFGPAGGSIPVPADYDGDGQTDIGVYQPSTGQWSIYRSSTGVLDRQFGLPGLDLPITAPITNRLVASSAFSGNSALRTARFAQADATRAAGMDPVVVFFPSEALPQMSPGLDSPGSRHLRQARSVHDSALEEVLAQVEATRDEFGLTSLRSLR